MKVLVLAENYSTPDGVVSLHYIHSRNKWYLEDGIEVSVVSFKTKYDYQVDGINVYTTKSYKEKLSTDTFDIVISHAPNLKNHLRFLKKFGNRFQNIVFYFHGHEVLKTSKVYPKPYKFVKRQHFIKTLMKETYDTLKLFVWKHEFPKFKEKSQFIFVSNWMYNMFLRFVKINPNIIKNKKHIIYNCVGKDFEDFYYDLQSEKEFDFITIRSNLDGSKYGIDIVTRIARNNPQYKFCVVGKGKYFEFYSKPDNLEWVDQNLNHKEVLDMLNKSKCALLPTRTDAQGVMACEMATYGIPLITSNIDVCKEVFIGFDNVELIDNDDENVDIGQILNGLQSVKLQEKNNKYFSINTVGKEIKLFREMKGQ